MITLLSDFGGDSPYVAQMKGSILRIAPGTTIVDLTHSVPPGEILIGAIQLRETALAFPEGTIHLAVVDPGVGTDRRLLAAQIRVVSPVSQQPETHYLICPDNGLATLFFENALEIEAVFLADPKYWLPKISRTFHGRDILGPVAAHLAAGVPLANFGPPVPLEKTSGRTAVVRIAIPEPSLFPDRIEGRVLYVDSFGNLITNLSLESLAGLAAGREKTFLVQSHEPEAGPVVARWVKTYGEAVPGEIVLLNGSSDRLEIAVVQGNAAARTGLRGGGRFSISRSTEEVRSTG